MLKVFDDDAVVDSIVTPAALRLERSRNIEATGTKGQNPRDRCGTPREMLSSRRSLTVYMAKLVRFTSWKLSKMRGMYTKQVENGHLFKTLGVDAHVKRFIRQLVFVHV